MRKLLLKISLVLVLIFTSTGGGGLLLPIAQAQVPPTNTTVKASDTSLVATYESMIKEFSGLMAIVVQALNYIIWPILILIGGLMDNSLIFGDGIADRLLLIWQQVRNLINLLFAVFLIGVAIYNVLGIKSDGNYALKSMLPKMVVTLILVNFSFLGCKLILDATNVATTAVFALPNTVEQGFSAEKIQTIENALCGEALNKIKNSSVSTHVNLQNQQVKLCEGNQFSTRAKDFFRQYDKNNAALVMAISFSRIDKVLEPSELVLKEPSIINLVINLLLVLLLEIAYISAFFALFAVLLARIVVSWVVIAISPLIVLKWGMNGVNIPGLSMLDGLDIDKKFLTHATAPIKIGVGMSIGYMMLDAFQSVGTPTLWFSLGEDFASVFSGLGSIPELFMGVASIAIVWKVSFDAASETYAKFVTERFRDWSEGLAKSVRDVVIKETPIVPTPSGTYASFGSLSRKMGSPDQLLKQKLQEKTDGGSSSQASQRDKARRLDYATQASQVLDNGTKFNDTVAKIQHQDDVRLVLHHLLQEGKSTQRRSTLDRDKLVSLIQKAKKQNGVVPQGVDYDKILAELQKNTHNTKKGDDLLSIPVDNGDNIRQRLRLAAKLSKSNQPVKQSEVEAFEKIYKTPKTK